MTATATRLTEPPYVPSAADRAWRDEFRAALLDVDRRVVALDVRRWGRVGPGGEFSVIGHLQLLRMRWRAVLQLSPGGFLPAAGPGVPRLDRSARAARPAAVLRAWRSAGWDFPDQLTTVLGPRRPGEHSAGLARQRAVELDAVHSCLLTAIRAGASAGHN
jgi:hypothetical protein